MAQKVNYFKKLSEQQRSVGYLPGELNVIALLGLLGESAEVLNECEIERHNNLPGKYLIISAIERARKVDMLKKSIRKDGLFAKLQMPYTKEKLKKLDLEICDVVYYLNALAVNRGKTLEEYAAIAYKKALKRKQRKVLHAVITKSKK